MVFRIFSFFLVSKNAPMAVINTLSAVPNRGKRNSSLNLPYVIQTIAELKGLSEEEVEQATWENACRVYRLEKE